MAAAELERRPLIVALVAVWVVTAACALLVGVVPGVSRLAVSWFDAPLTAGSNPPPTVGRALELALHNMRVFCFPFLLAAARLQQRRLRIVVDVLLVADVVVQAGLVGAALGAYQTRVAPYLLPHLVFEWLGMAAAIAVWLIARRRIVTRRELTILAAVFVVALLTAGFLETYATPHR